MVNPRLQIGSKGALPTGSHLQHAWCKSNSLLPADLGTEIVLPT